MASPIFRLMFPLAASVALAMPALAADMTREQLDAWFNAPSEKSARDVNEGDLVFLGTLPRKPVHHHHSLLVINDASLASGWTALVQCHEHLDQVPAAQILFNRERTRNIEIISRSGIDQAWVEGASVQLKNIGSGARLCVSARSRALTDNGDGTYSLRNGPFMRKFLDGYYPMRVSMTVKLDSRKLHFERITPPVQEGFKVWNGGQEVNFEAWFEGRLSTEMLFSTW